MKLRTILNLLFESNQPKYSVGQMIDGVGKIKQVFTQKDKKRIWFQYEIDGSYYAETVLDDIIDELKVKKISFESIKKLAHKIQSGSPTDDEIRLGWKIFNFLNTSKGRETFKKFDTKVVSKFNWLQANLGSAVSKYPEFK